MANVAPQPADSAACVWVVIADGKERGRIMTEAIVKKRAKRCEKASPGGVAATAG